MTDDVSITLKNPGPIRVKSKLYNCKGISSGSPVGTYNS